MGVGVEHLEHQKTLKRYICVMLVFPLSVFAAMVLRFILLALPVYCCVYDTGPLKWLMVGVVVGAFLIMAAIWGLIASGMKGIDRFER